MRHRPVLEDERDVSPDAPMPAPAVAAPGLSAQSVLGLQRSHGNQAVARLLHERALQRVIGDGGQKRKRDDNGQGGPEAPQPKRQVVETPGDQGPAVQPGADQGPVVQPGPGQGAAVQPGADQGPVVQPGPGQGAAVQPEADQEMYAPVGGWIPKMNNEKMLYWKRSDNKWHFTHFKTTGDYHLKGNAGPNKAYEKGYFNETFAVVTKAKSGGKNASAAAIAEGDLMYRFCMENLVPLLSHLPNYKPPRLN